eukprot:4059372-Amphidinium_carterae.3
MAQGGKLADCIADYTLSQTSLEEVFLFFSKLADTIETQEVALVSQADALMPIVCGKVICRPGHNEGS